MGIPTRFALVAIGLAVLPLAGCGTGIDLRRARICRLAAVALADPVAIFVTRQDSLLSDDENRSGIRVELARAAPPAPRWVECRFAPIDADTGPDLVRVDTDHGRLPDANLYVLKRFWIESPDSARADPMLGEDARRLPAIPQNLAYAVQQILASIPNAAIYALLAAAYSLIYGLSGRINLAFGEIAAVGGFAAMIGVAAAVGSAPVILLLCGIGLALWASAIHGAVIERLVVWPLRRSTGQQGLVATIGVALFLQEYMRLAGGNQPKWIGEILETPVGLLHAQDFVVTVTPIALILGTVAIVAALGVLALLHFSGFGRAWRATADDPLAAALFGVDPRRLSALTFALACGLAGLAGATVTVFYGSISFTYTTTLGLKALIAAIVGGIGSVSGAFLGGLAIAMVEAGWSAYFPIEYRDLVVDVLMVAVLVFRPGGFFGYRDLLPRRV
ncbi:MAG TPA: branched-chain amino acid ABC transporter permease [Lichenihabitans sp.]|jgi:branched-subunit amino acid ABC-type transport system permease component|nr:branched-chain amino acid ABC transporter permease [Lichenihabitans sp.]